MRYVRLILICLALGIAKPAAAFCEGWDKGGLAYYSVKNEFARSQYVATVRVEHETWLGLDGKPKTLKVPFQNGNPRPFGFDDYMGAYYDVVTIERFKGQVPRHFRLFSENSTARFWLLPGREYVVLVSSGKFDPPIRSALSVDTCGNSPRPLKQSARLVRRLRSLRSKHRQANQR